MKEKKLKSLKTSDCLVRGIKVQHNRLAIVLAIDLF